MAEMSEVQRLEEAVNSLQVQPITPPLAAETWFEYPGEFAFGLPRGFARPSREMERAWERRNGEALLCIDEPDSADYAMFLMIQRNDQLLKAYAPMARTSIWVLFFLENEFRKTALNRRSRNVTLGPKPILIGEERAIRFDLSEVDDGIDTRQCIAQVIHQGRGYEVFMFVKAYAQPKYEEVFLTALGSWKWLGTAAQKQGAQLSSDGQWWWDGARWQSAISPDGKWRWNGREWAPWP
jgi:hypothetical protein